MFGSVKGTHDLILKETDKYELVEFILTFLAKNYGYRQIITPIIEHTELFTRSVGDSSDIVRKEMYTFKDKGGRSISLRPEFTAGIIRSIVNNKTYVSQDLPIKAYYLGPCFRYERPSAGRYRQFNQFGVESIGVDNYLRDAETIIYGYRALADGLKLGDKITVKINTLGDEETREKYQAALRKYFKKHLSKMCNDCKTRYELNVLRMLDCKTAEDQKFVQKAPKIFDFLSVKAKKEFANILKTLEINHVKYELDDSLVRGLDYYSGVVFEYIYEGNNNKYGALGGGGHYNNLVEECGGPKLEGVGLSFGIERLISVLNEEKIFDEISTVIDFYVMPYGDDEVKNHALTIADVLRSDGYNVEVCLEDKNFSQMFKRAEKRFAAFAVIVGDAELKNDCIKIKNLKTQEQTLMKLNDEKNETFLDRMAVFFEENQEKHSHDDDIEC